MSKIISIGTAVPEFRHEQDDILRFMQQVYAMNEVEKRKLKFLYHQSSIKTRYSVLPDYSLPAGEWTFYPGSENLEPFPSLEMRMQWFDKTAPALSIDAITKCADGRIDPGEITHLITVSCTGISAPGLDLQIIEAMGLQPDIFRTSVNFMGCFAAIHALKMADAICNSNGEAKAMIVCTELSTLHFQKERSQDSITSSMLFGDGCAAVLVTGDKNKTDGFRIKNFHSHIAFNGKKDMSWRLSSTGFQMTLSTFIPDLIEHDFGSLVEDALNKAGMEKGDISDWCIHPGGKKILSVIEKSMRLPENSLSHSHNVLQHYGNMSSPTLLFVLQEIMQTTSTSATRNIFGAAFGPGLTMETFILTND